MVALFGGGPGITVPACIISYADVEGTTSQLPTAHSVAQQVSLSFGVAVGAVRA
jgi:hypothetical protein